MKKGFSSSVANSLTGRSGSNSGGSEPESVKDTTVNRTPEEPAETKKKSNAGRKRKAIEDKKVQMTLTLTPATFNALKEWAKAKPRTAPNYISEYIEEHLNDIIK